MTGKELFDRYQNVALRNGFGTDAFNYGNLLFQALKIEGEEKVFLLLEEAEKTGKRIGLGYASEPQDSFAEPDIAILIDPTFVKSTAGAHAGNA